MAHTSLDYIGIFLTQFYTHNCILTGKGEFIQFLLKERVLLIGNLKTASQKQEIILTATDLTMSYINVRYLRPVMLELCQMTGLLRACTYLNKGLGD